MASGNYAKKVVQPAHQDEITSPRTLRAQRTRTSIEDYGPDSEEITFKESPNQIPVSNQPITRPKPTSTTQTVRTATTQNTRATTTQSMRAKKVDPTTDTIMFADRTMTTGARTRKPTRNLAEDSMDTGVGPGIGAGMITSSAIAAGIAPTTRSNPLTAQNQRVARLKSVREVNADRAITADAVVLQPSSVLGHNGPWLRPWLLCTFFITIALLVLITAGIYQRNDTIMNYGGGQSYAVQVSSGTWAKSTQPAPIQKPIPSHPGPYAVLGKPTISAAFINQVLQANHSPAAGKGQALYDLGVRYDIDPAFALAFFMHESSFGTQGEAQTTLSLGNLRCYTGATCIDQDRGGYAQYATWEDGFQAWYQLIHNFYVAQLGEVTIDQIIPTYAPNADHNDEAAYISSLKTAINTWHANQIYVN
ncbi:glucosaminidase domain-containing protein [Ktedonobacteria bacterium brp13]|nr:glucosaminidase domain-containing protein [Ktedonobacteria bacterium brp13]